MHPAITCHEGHGAAAVAIRDDASVADLMLSECKAACLAIPECFAIVVPQRLAGGEATGVCALRGAIANLEECESDIALDTYSLHEPRRDLAALPPNSSFVVDDLNRRFREAKDEQALDMASFGLLLHQFDATDTYDAPWVQGGTVVWSDRLSGSFVSKFMTPQPEGQIPLFSHTQGGFVMRPSLSPIYCQYPMDSGTFARRCYNHERSDSFLPGCTPPNDYGGYREGSNFWCLRGQGPWWPCTWPGHRTTDMNSWREDRRSHYDGCVGMCGMNKRRIVHYYNEIIVDEATWRRNLPEGVEAFFYIRRRADSPDGECNDLPPGTSVFLCEPYARTVHRTFLETFGKTEEEVPLLELDIFDWETPFKQVRNPGGTPRR